MSLDVTIKYKQPKMVDYNKAHAACGSLVQLAEDGEREETVWWANITSNMGEKRA